MLCSTLTLQQLIDAASTGDNVLTWVADQLSAALKEPGEDLLGAVARGVNEGVLTEHEGTGMLLTLLSAGGETTTSLLGNAVRMLADNPDLQDHLRRNLDQIPTFAEEALRLESPFRYMMRSVPKDTTLGSVDIPADSTVLLLWGAANRDATEFENPDEIDLARRIRDGMSRSVAASTPVSARHWHASRHVWCSPACWSAPPISRCNRSTRQAGSTASSYDATDNCPYNFRTDRRTPPQRVGAGIRRRHRAGRTTSDYARVTASCVGDPSPTFIVWKPGREGRPARSTVWETSSRWFDRCSRRTRRPRRDKGRSN